MQSILNYEVYVRLGFFVVVLCGMGAWEYYWPRRLLRVPRKKRWPGNFSIGFINILCLRIVLPITAIGVAELAHLYGWGLLHQIRWPVFIQILLSVIVLDLMIYLQHVLLHRWAWCWRFHRAHHSDPEFDISTGIRFHPFEIILSMLWKMTIIILLGVPAIAVLVYEVCLSVFAIFNHANAKLPAGLDNCLRSVIVTPDMHRIHHSVKRIETDSNFGNLLSFWDRLFGTYRYQPIAGHKDIQLGLIEFQAKPPAAITDLLLQPFVNIRADDDKSS